MSSSSRSSDFTLALVGAGNMGGAMLGGWLKGGMPPENITVIDPSPPPAMARMLQAYGMNAVATAPEGYQPDVLVLAVKPQIFDKVMAANTGICGPGTVVVSVAAGKTVATMASILGSRAGAIVRAMPNTPALVGRGITACFANQLVSALQRDRISHLLGATGSVEWVGEEALIDAVTAVSGSGPAYVFHLAECMAAAGIAQGLPADLAMRLARETVCGAGELMHQSSDTAERLRQNVTSPNGTTAAALAVLMGEGGLAPLMDRAIAAARKRSEELSG
ncbi:MAG: pyrroline-5-carboxylate reductase [Nitratireductor sp.]|nr:pyrroline-5-carboxylate reductase [Nitratireductor sp.]